MRMRAMLVGLLALAATSAHATEKPRHNGPYIGLMAGYGTNMISPEGGTFDWAGAGATGGWAGAGATGGAFAGYGVNVANGLYLGLEGDIALRDIKGTASDGITSITAKNELMGTVRGRAGFIAGPALLYATAGVAITESKLAVTGLGSDDKLIYGLVAGVGIEAEITRVMFVRIEGRHTRFQDETFSLLPGLNATVDRQADNTIMGGLGFKF